LEHRTELLVTARWPKKVGFMLLASQFISVILHVVSHVPGTSWAGQLKLFRLYHNESVLFSELFVLADFE